VYTYEGKEGKVHLVFEPELKLDSFISEDKDKTIAALTQNFTDQIEKIVRRYPEQWMWVHRRWKDIN
jgi:KDO2-lipid IV(A) lauroyltransferase